MKLSKKRTFHLSYKNSLLYTITMFPAVYSLLLQDNPDLFAMMEKTRMYIFRGTDPEEPIISSGHICTFEAMQVRSVLLDMVIRDPENPTDDLVVDLDIKVSQSILEFLKKQIVELVCDTVLSLSLSLVGTVTS